MKKFRLIKEYPGSPEIGTVHSDENKLGEWQGYNYYEEYPEYWKDVVEHIYYMVSLIDMGFHNAWEPMRVEAIKYDTDTKKYFSAKEVAIYFIIQHKPCFSFDDINKEITTDNSKFRMLHNLSELAKSRI